MINMVRPVELADDQLAAAAAGTLDVHDLALGLKAAGIEDSRSAGNLGLAGSLAAELTEHAREALAQRGQRELLADVGPAVLRAAADHRRDGPGRAVPARQRPA